MKVQPKIKEGTPLYEIRKAPIKTPIILFMAYDRDDNNKFTSRMTEALLAIDKRGEKFNIKNLICYFFVKSK